MRRFFIVLGLFVVALTTPAPSRPPHDDAPIAPSMTPVVSWEALAQPAAEARWYRVASEQPAPRRQAVRSSSRTVSYEPASDIESLICSVFTEDCAHAVRIARCESGLNPSARNRSGASGLFQLLGHGDMFEAHGWSRGDVFDAYRNTVVAHDLYLSSGWRPWVCR